MDLGPDCLICRITSVPHHGFLDLPVTNWQEAGLEKPSTYNPAVSFGHGGKASPQGPYRKIGPRGFGSGENAVEGEVPSGVIVDLQSEGDAGTPRASNRTLGSTQMLP
ncbi:MAG: hypothetical protein KGL31_08260 [candidate division NC10 bacterium]|nr:hypothetical protein [candidate division NC10 bacterium]MDE2321892.1 hypothetical protein [candidate division NC10 bacterium]